MTPEAEAPRAASVAAAEEPYKLTRWHYATISLLVLGYSGYYFCRSDYSVALPLLLAEQVGKGVPANLAQVRLGSIASLGVLAYAIGKFPSGACADLFGGRRNFLGGMAGSILFTLLFMLGGGFPVFTLAWIGNRFVQSLGWAGLVKVSSRWFAYSTYGTVMGALSLSYLFGDAISREAMSLLLGAGVGWRGVFLAGAGILGALLAANLLLLRETPAERGLPTPRTNPENLYAEAERSGRRASLGALLGPLVSSRNFWFVCALSLGTTLLRETFNLWTPTYFTQVVGLSNAQAASGSALFPFFGGLSVILAGVMSDRLGSGGRGRILFGGLLCSVGALAMLGVLPPHGSPLAPISLVSLVGFLIIGPYSYLAGAMSLDFGGDRGSGTASGIIDGVGYLGGVLSGGAMARVTVVFGWQSVFFVLAGVALLSSIFGAGLIWSEQRRKALGA
jgi:OPA family glycerol-3-phosphate transporter-like MFS transporter